MDSIIWNERISELRDIKQSNNAMQYFIINILYVMYYIGFWIYFSFFVYNCKFLGYLPFVDLFLYFFLIRESLHIGPGVRRKDVSFCSFTTKYLIYLLRKFFVLTLWLTYMLFFCLVLVMLHLKGFLLVFFRMRCIRYF